LVLEVTSTIEASKGKLDKNLSKITETLKKIVKLIKIVES